MQNSIYLRRLNTKETLLALLLAIPLALLMSCQDGDLSGLNDEAAIASLGIVSISVAVNNPVYRTPDNGIAIMPQGEVQQFDATGITDTGETVPSSELNSDVTWTVSDANLATIDKNGLLTATAAGSVTVSATIGTLPSTSATIEVSAAPVSTITTSVADAAGSLDYQLCKPTQLEAITLYQIDTTPTTFTWDVTDTVTWTSDEPDTAVHIDAATAGLVAYIGAPPADATPPTVKSSNFTATLGDTATSDTVTLNLLYSADDFSSLKIEADTTQLSPKSTTQLRAIATRASGTDRIENISSWDSTDISVATVGTTGLVTAIATGSATINSSCGGKNATTAITVSETKTLSYIEFDLTGATTDDYFELSVNDTRPLKATAFYSDGSTDTTIASSQDSDWTEIDFSTGNVINIDNTNTNSGENKGLVTAVAVGVARVTLTFKSGADTSTRDITIEVIP